MKLLFDENLSRKLVARLAELYPESAHVAEVDLLESPDREIWGFARTGNFVIVSTDSDFYELATTIGRRRPKGRRGRRKGRRGPKGPKGAEGASLT